ncbi:DUF5615 family PIN-like protein [Methyloceanibacter sp.]|uniref:DUF5615 family PIN-like protein n=1 Tax=Methyloceanibacter sp. TaxID=1965321 RepID=UPI003D6C8922
MRFVVDAQLPPALARYLSELGHQADHVIDLGLESASDRNVWDAALARSATLVTKDEDFIAMRAIQGDGPAIIWVRIGNTTTTALFEALSRVWPAVVAALEAGEGVIEVR